MKKNKGFTLIELLIVSAIIGLLAAIIIPGFMAVNSRSIARKICQGEQLSFEEAEKYKKDKKSLDEIIADMNGKGDKCVMKKAQEKKQQVPPIQTGESRNVNTKQVAVEKKEMQPIVPPGMYVAPVEPVGPIK